VKRLACFALLMCACDEPRVPPPNSTSGGDAGASEGSSSVSSDDGGPSDSDSGSMTEGSDSESSAASTEGQACAVETYAECQEWCRTQCTLDPKTECGLCGCLVDSDCRGVGDDTREWRCVDANPSPPDVQYGHCEPA